MWDNIKNGTEIACPEIEKALTNATISDRILSVSRRVRGPELCGFPVGGALQYGHVAVHTRRLGLQCHGRVLCVRGGPRTTQLGAMPTP
jgi:hypothetical protein